MNFFRPNKFRYFSWFLLICVVGAFFSIVVIVSLLAPFLSPAYILFFEICATVGGAIGGFLTLEQGVIRAQIVITDEVISGPPVWGNRRIQFPLNNLDKEKSSNRNFFQQIFGYQLIQSKTGEKIIFVERTFDKDQVSMILDLLGCTRLETN